MCPFNVPNHPVFQLSERKTRRVIYRVFFPQQCHKHAAKSAVCTTTPTDGNHRAFNMAARSTKCSVKWRDREKYEEAEKLPLELDPRFFVRGCVCVCVCVEGMVIQSGFESRPNTYHLSANNYRLTNTVQPWKGRTTTQSHLLHTVEFLAEGEACCVPL